MMWSLPSFLFLEQKSRIKCTAIVKSGRDDSMDDLFVSAQRKGMT